MFSFLNMLIVVLFKFKNKFWIHEKERFNYRWKKQTKNQSTIHKKDSQTAEGKKSGETLVITEVRQWVGKQVICKSLKERDALLNDWEPDRGSPGGNS